VHVVLGQNGDSQASSKIDRPFDPKFLVRLSQPLNSERNGVSTNQIGEACESFENLDQESIDGRHRKDGDQDVLVMLQKIVNRQ
jgi:hypothetical protein